MIKLLNDKVTQKEIPEVACGSWASYVCGKDPEGCGFWSKDCCSITDGGACGIGSYDCTDSNGKA